MRLNEAKLNRTIGMIKAGTSHRMTGQETTTEII